MSVFLHVGYPKTGSSSLQLTLSKNQKKLNEHGLTYPLIDKDFKQRYLGYFSGLGKDARQGKNAASKLARLMDVVENTDNSVILSSEELSSSFIYHDRTVNHEEQLYLLRTELEKISKDIHILMYVRQPLSLYVSLMQERLKRNPDVIAPSNFSCSYIAAVNAFEQAFDTTVNLRKFERSTLIGGDIVKDFFSYLSFYTKQTVFPLESSNANDSISGEAMHILWDLRRMLNDERVEASYDFNDSEILWRNINAVDKKFGVGRKAKLKSGIVETIERNNLRETAFLESRGITFSDDVIGNLVEETELGDPDSSDFDNIFSCDAKKSKQLRNLFTLALIRSLSKQ